MHWKSFICHYLYELFGPGSTQYLSENSDIQMSLLGNIRKRRGFAYITVPAHAVKVKITWY